MVSFSGQTWNEKVANTLEYIATSSIVAFVQVSGLATALLISGNATTVSGMGVLINPQSGLPVIITASSPAWIKPSVHTLVSANSFTVGTSSTQFPNVAGVRHIIGLLQSGIVYIAGVNTVTSGTGAIICGAPNDSRASMELNVNNLNIIYGVAITSSIMTHISFT